ncbi:MAG: hypothetical protein VW258_15910 [Thalassolituus sp.]
MLRALIFILLPLFTAGCLPEEKTDDIVNDQGEAVKDPTLRLNGLWNGQVDQAGALRALIYNGNIFAFDENIAYYGTVSLAAATDTVTITVEGYGYSSSETDANQYVAGGSSESFVFTGLVFPTLKEDDTLVGDYESDSGAGGFTLSDDGTWETNSSLAALKGKWSATNYDLYLTEVNGVLSFREVSVAATPTGCTSYGTISLLNKEQNLYSVQLTERKNCAGFNVINAPGYASVDSFGDLELFIRKDDELLYTRYSAASSADSSTDTATDTTTEETTTTE